jgi:hypothetical protein
MLGVGQRPVGVKIPEDQTTDRTNKPDLHVENLLPMEFFAMQYVEKGKMKMGLVAHSGGQFYLAPSGSEWLAGMRPLSDKLVKNLKPHFERLRGPEPIDPTGVPTSDDVDIVAAATASEE